MQAEAFQSWAIVEVMGHSTFAGYVTEQVIGGTTFVRVDVPAVGKEPAFTKLLGAASIYAITPVAEEVATRAAAGMRTPPINVYLPALPAAAHAAVDAEYDDDMEEHD